MNNSTPKEIAGAVMCFVVSGLVLLITPGFIIAQGGQPSEERRKQEKKAVQQIFDRVRQHTKKGNYSGALLLLEGEVPPKYHIPSYHYLKAQQLLYLYRTEKAKTKLEEFRGKKGVKPNVQSRILWMLGDLEKNNRNFQTAIKRYRLAMAKDEKVVVPAVKLAVSLYDGWGRTEMARKYLVDAQVRATRSENAFKQQYVQSVMAMLDAASGKSGRAEKEVEMTEMNFLPRRNAVIAFFLAAASHLLDNRSDTMAYLKKALFDEPNRVSTRINIQDKVRRSRALKDLPETSETVRQWVHRSRAEHPKNWTFLFGLDGPEKIEKSSWPDVTFRNGWKLMASNRFSAASNSRDVVVRTLLSNLERWFSRALAPAFPKTALTGTVNFRVYSKKKTFKKRTGMDPENRNWVWNDENREYRMYEKQPIINVFRPDHPLLKDILKQVMDSRFHNNQMLPVWIRSGLKQYAGRFTSNRYIFRHPEKLTDRGIKPGNANTGNLRNLISAGSRKFKNEEGSELKALAEATVGFLLSSDDDTWNELLPDVIRRVRNGRSGRSAVMSFLSEKDRALSDLATDLSEALKNNRGD